MKRRVAMLAGALCATGVLAGDVSEKDFYADLPVVLSVSRLAQPLDETPGAVTVIDRELIRRSGARSLADVLRLVPGFIITAYEGGARPAASYHGEFDDLQRHLQVFIDGRSTYSSLLLGTASYGMNGVVMDDIERIEVLRGSNSAAYGANAFLGVVNVITRHAADTVGGMLATNVGESRLRDMTARIGWGDERAAFRVTASQRADTGQPELNDGSRIVQAHFRGDLQPGTEDEVSVAAGHTRFGWGVQDTPPRNESWDNSYAQAQWTRRLAGDQQLKLRAQLDTEAYRDFYPNLRADGRSQRIELEAAHSLAPAKNWRMVWGGQYRHEEVVSRYLFYSEPEQQFALWRVFGNAEWRPHPQWVVNAGGLVEHHGLAGTRTAPRLMVNFHALPGHTLRLGATIAHKQPTLFEMRADWRLGVVPLVRASGKARAETIDSTEFGYLGQFRSLGVSVDVRGFEERTRDLLRFARPCGGCPNDVLNKDPNTQRGWEAQVRWQPLADTQVIVNHTELRFIPDVASTAPQDSERVPRRYGSVALFQRLPADWDLALIHIASESYFTVRLSDKIPAYRQTDLRLARAFRIGTTRAEVAFNVRAIDGEHLGYVLRGAPLMRVDRRAHLELRLEY